MSHIFFSQQLKSEKGKDCQDSKDRKDSTSIYGCSGPAKRMPSTNKTKSVADGGCTVRKQGGKGAAFWFKDNHSTSRAVANF